MHTHKKILSKPAGMHNHKKKSKQAGMHTPDVNGEYTGGSGDHEYLFFEQFWSNGAGVFDLLRPGLKSINPGQIAVN